MLILVVFVIVFLIQVCVFFNVCVRFRLLVSIANMHLGFTAVFMCFNEGIESNYCHFASWYLLLVTNCLNPDLLYCLVCFVA